MGFSLTLSAAAAARLNQVCLTKRTSPTRSNQKKQLSLWIKETDTSNGSTIDTALAGFGLLEYCPNLIVPPCPSPARVVPSFAYPSGFSDVSFLPAALTFRLFSSTFTTQPNKASSLVYFLFLLLSLLASRPYFCHPIRYLHPSSAYQTCIDRPVNSLSELLGDCLRYSCGF